MSRCANSHDRDETCVDCDPGPRRKPGRIVPRSEALEIVHELREQLASTPDPAGTEPSEEETVEP